MSKARHGLFIEYCAKDFLDGTQMLSPWEELAYRRICDLIYATGDQLTDDDKKLAWMTKAGNRWKSIKTALIAMEKIQIVDGRITNERCRKTLEKSAQNIAQKVIAGKSSAASRKLLNHNKTGSTAVDAAVATAVPTAVATNQEPISTELSDDNSSTADAVPPAAVSPTPSTNHHPDDLKTRIFAGGLDWLVTHSGKSADKLRPMIGRWCSRYGDGAVLDALIIAAKETPIDPVAWIEAKLNGKAPGNGTKYARPAPRTEADDRRAILKAVGLGGSLAG